MDTQIAVVIISSCAVLITALVKIPRLARFTPPKGLTVVDERVCLIRVGAITDLLTANNKSVENRLDRIEKKLDSLN